MTSYEKKVVDPMMRRWASDWGGKVGVQRIATTEQEVVLLRIQAREEGDGDSKIYRTAFRLSMDDAIQLAIFITSSVAKLREDVEDE